MPMKSLFTITCCAFSLVLLGCTYLCAAPQRPHILFIAVDDLRPQLGCYGHTEAKSPHIDRLAQQGVLFSRAYCQVPVCGASRASLLTGLRPLPKRFMNAASRADKDAPGIVGLPQFFKNHGYRTHNNGKIYHHDHDSGACWDTNYRPQGIGQYQKPENIALKKKTKKAAPYECCDVSDDVLQGGKIANQAIADLKAAEEAGVPAFVGVGFTKPHLPFIAPKKYWDLYEPNTIKLAANPQAPKGCPPEALHNWAELRRFYSGVPKKGPVSKELARNLIHGYYACVSYTDAMIGRLLDALDELKIRDNTIVILWGDHGWQLGEHGLWCKHCNFNTSLQAPLIVSAAGLTKGAICKELVEFVDIYPTLCELAGLPLPQHLQGDSFVPQLKNPQQPGKPAVFARFRNGESIRTERYLYTEFNSGARMLYDHHNDPQENNNIAGQPENQAVVEQLSKELRQHIQSRN